MSGGPFQHEAAVSGGGCGYSARFPRLRIFGMGSSFSSNFVPFVPLPARRAAGPCVARIARGRARPSAPARFARLIARARRRTHFSRPFLKGFSRRREPKGETAPRMPLPPVPSYHSFPRVNPVVGTLSDFMNKKQFSVTVSILLSRRQPPAWPPVGRPGPMVSGAGLQTQRQRAADPNATPASSSSNWKRSNTAPPGSAGPSPTAWRSASTAPCSTSTSASWDARSSAKASTPCRPTSTPISSAALPSVAYQGRDVRGRTPDDVTVQCLRKPKTPRRKTMKEAA